MKAAILSLIAAVLGAPAQTGTSAITGTITDPAGAAVAGAKVTAINSESGARLETLSNDAGAYRIPALSPGIYTVQAETPGSIGRSAAACRSPSAKPSRLTSPCNSGRRAKP